LLDSWVAGSIGAEGNLTRGQIDDWTLKALKRTVERAAAQSPFYAERLKGLRISNMEDFKGLPFTYPDDLRRDSLKMLCIPGRDVKRIVSLTTSESSGEPKRVYFSERDLLETVNYFAHGLKEFTKEGEKALLLFPGSSPDGLNDLIIRALEMLGCRGEWFGYPREDRFAELAERILGQQITFLIGTAASVAAFARFTEQTDPARKIAGQIRGVLASAAYVSEEDRAAIIRAWDCEVNEHYSMTETGYAGAVGCSVPGGYHVWESGLYYELIDPVTGIAVPDGEEGEIVVTTLTERAEPFIRYRTGDIARFVPGRCACGSCLKRLERVHDRDIGKKFEREDIENEKICNF